MVEQLERVALIAVVGQPVDPGAVLVAARDRFDEWLAGPFDAVLDAEDVDDRTRLHRLLGVA